MIDLTNKQYAEKMRQAADLMEDVGRLYTAQSFRKDADALDPPDPYAGLNRVRWVEIEDGYGTRRVTHVRGARESHPDWSLVRVVPDGDARDVLVIPVEDAREASKDAYGAAFVVRDALAEHEARWSS